MLIDLTGIGVEMAANDKGEVVFSVSLADGSRLRVAMTAEQALDLSEWLGDTAEDAVVKLEARRLHEN